MTSKPAEITRYIVPALIFLAVSSALWLEPKDFLLVYPAYGFMFVWFSFRGEREVRFLFLFFITAIGFALPRVSAPSGALSSGVAAFAEVLSMWLLFYALHSYEAGTQEIMDRAAANKAAVLGVVRDLRDELKRYHEHKESLLNRAKVQSELSSSIQKLSQASGAEEIKTSLEALLKGYFAGSDVFVHSGAPSDFMQTWVAERKIPLLVRNSHEEGRFSKTLFKDSERSLMVMPMTLFGSVIGFIKVSSSTGGKFRMEDLRSAEMLSTIAGVSMENISLFEKVREMAIKDGLTGLYTHRAFQGRMEEEILRSARTKIPFSLIMADIDHFKSYNDTWGHQAGDEVLKATASVFASGVRDIDFVARYGGEEFGILLTGVSKPQASAVAENLRLSLESRQFVFGGRPSKVTASFGVAEFPSEGAIASQLVRAADERLYKAKKSGRNRVIYE